MPLSVGHKVRVRTDHGCLTWLKIMKYLSGQVARWIEHSAPYSWTIEHWPSVNHQKADALSRMPCPGTCTQCSKIRK